MATHKGKTVRRKVPEPRIEKPAEGQRAVTYCCLCGSYFDAEKLEGSFGARRCLRCGLALSEKVYDRIADSRLTELAECEAAQSALEPECELLHAKIARVQRWRILRPYRRYLERKLAPLEKDKSAAAARVADLYRELAKLAYGRYYAGKWFQLTRIPLERKGDAAHKLKPLYADGGLFELSPRDKAAAGIRAEFTVFERLREKCLDEASPLYGARPLPNLYLPHERRGRTFWSQVDIVLLTDRAAFVIEVKSRRCAIESNSPFEQVIGPGGKQYYTTEALTAALSQNSRHAADFADACPAYVFDQVFEQIVFFRPESFKTDACTFVENVNVGALGDSVGTDFTVAIEDALKDLPPLLTARQLERIVDNMLSHYGDLSQQRVLVHARSVR